MPHTEGQKTEGGIFTPWEKVLEGINVKLDRVIDMLNAKVDNTTFIQFQQTYEARHEKLVTKIDNLERDKIGREAVESYRRLFITGGAFTGVLTILNIVLVALALSKGLI